MKNYDERMENIRVKANQLKSRRRTAAVCCVLFVAVLALTLLTPYYGQDSAIEPKYELIPDINMDSYHIVGNGSDYERLKDVLSAPPTSSGMTIEELKDIIELELNGATATIGGVVSSLKDPFIADGNQKYEEVTDNQVQGVIESDIFKRSDKYIYYLRDNILSVYSINKMNSAQIAILEFRQMWNSIYLRSAEMFLSSDGTKLTLLFDQSLTDLGTCTVVYSLDVSDPANIQVQEPLVFKGSYITSRMVDDKLLLIYNYNDVHSVDLGNPENFVPVYGTQDELHMVPAEDIFCPAEKPTSARYTVIAQLDAKTLQVEDTAALLGYSRKVYVSQSGIYLTYGYNRYEDKGTSKARTSYTDITGISYGGDNLDILGTVTVEGSIKDQYSMDEYNGVLRVATSARAVERERDSGTIRRINNCNLYCINLSSWKVASSVIAFAPEGEEVMSARFDGPLGYICTAEVVTMRDPVYFFDLSDIYNITYKHTPVIDGYSSSLINFGNYLLGIGYNENRGLKVEAYKETDDGVEPVAAYERAAGFSQEYKSYYIDREKNMVGLAVKDSTTGVAEYILLHLDGNQFVELAKIPIAADEFDVGSIFFGEDLSKCRADIIDGYLYLLEETLHVKRLWIE